MLLAVKKRDGQLQIRIPGKQAIAWGLAPGQKLNLLKKLGNPHDEIDFR